MEKIHKMQSWRVCTHSPGTAACRPGRRPHAQAIPCTL